MPQPRYISTQTGDVSTDLYDLEGLQFPKKGGKVKGVVESTSIADPEFEKIELPYKYNRHNYLINSAPAPVNYIGDTDVGESIYDEGINSPNQLDNLPDTRAQLQPWYDQAGAAIAKGGILAGTTFLDGTIGTIAGLGNMAAEGKGSAYWDNPFSQTMADVNKWSEEALPNYYSDVEKQNDANGEWYKNIFTPNFVFDKVAKNMGFAIGAIGAGYVGGLGIEAVGSKLGLGVVRNLATGTAQGEAAMAEIGNIASGARQMSGAEIAATAAKNAKSVSDLGIYKYWGGSILGAQGEARIEAINNTRDFQDLKTNQLRDVVAQKRDAMIQQLSQDSRNLISVPKYNDSGAFIGMETTLSPAAEKQVADFTNKEMTRGMSIIKDATETMGNNVFLGNMALLSLTNAFQFGNYFKGGFKASAKNINKYIKPVLNEAGETIGTTVEKKAFKNIAKGAAGNFIAEGPVEEMGQGVISKGAGYQQAARINTLYGATIDPEASKDTENGFNALAKAAAETYGTSAGWEEGFIGGITGLIGIPGISINNGKVKLKLEGGIKEAVTEHNETVKAAEEVSQQLNQIYGSEKFQEYTQGLVRGKSFDAQMAKAAADKDAFSYKNAEHASLINAAITFEKADRIDDLYNMINSAANATEEDIKQARTITKEDGTSLYEGMTDAEIKQQFKDRAAKQKEAVDKYRKIASDLSSTISDKFHGEELEEMVFMASNIDNLESRFKEVHEEIKQPLNTIAAHLEQKYGDEVKSKAENIREIANMNPTEMSLTLSKAENKANVEKLKNLYTDLQKSYNLNKDDLGSKINDLSKLMETRLATLDKFNSFMSNPSKLTEEIQEAKAQVEVVNKEQKVNEQKDKLANITNYQNFKTAVNSVQDNDTKLATQEALNQLTQEKHPMATVYNKHNSVQEVLNKEIDNQVAPQEVKNLAKQLVENAHNISTENDSLSDINHLAYNEDIVVDKDNVEHTIDGPLLKQARDLVNQATIKVNGTKVENTKANEFTPNPNQPKPVENKPVKNPGSNTIEEAKEDNKKINEQLNNQETTANTTKLPGTDYYKYWKPEISEYKIQDKNDSNFNQTLGESWSGITNLYNWLVNKNAFNFVNQGKLKKGDKIFFIISKEVNTITGDNYNPILIATLNPNSTGEGDKYQILGLLEESGVHKFVGMTKLRERILEGYKNAINKDFYVQDEFTTVDSIEPGRIKFDDSKSFELQEVKDNPNNGDVQKILVGVIKNGRMEVNNNPNIKVEEPLDKKEGRPYLLIRGGNGTYLPALLRTKRFNKSLDTSNMKEVEESIKKVLQSIVTIHNSLGTASPDANSTSLVVKEKALLNEIIYASDDSFRIDLNDSVANELTDNGVIPDINTVSIKFKYEGQEIEVFTEGKDNETIVNELYEGLKEFNLHFNIKIKDVNGVDNNQGLIDSNIAVVNTDRLTTVSSYPFINPLDDNGQPIQAELPKYNNQTNPIITSPNEGTEIKGTDIEYNGSIVRVDTTNKIIYTQTKNKGFEAKEYNDAIERETILVKAWIEENKTNKEWVENNIIGDIKTGKIILNKNTGKIFDLKTQSIITEEVKPKEIKPQSKATPLMAKMGNKSLTIEEPVLTKINQIDSVKLSKIDNFAKLPKEIQQLLKSKDISKEDWETVYTKEMRENELNCL